MPAESFISWGSFRRDGDPGGIALEEVHAKTMESRQVRGLFFAGEVLDIDGDTGGFNLQAAFSTGFLAAQGINKRIGEHVS